MEKKDILVRVNSPLSDAEVRTKSLEFINGIQANYNTGVSGYKTYIYGEIFDARSKRVVKLFSDLAVAELFMQDQEIVQFDPNSSIVTRSGSRPQDVNYVDLDCMDYALTETLTESRWIDEKPLYRLVFQLPNQSTAGNYVHDLLIPEIESITDITCITTNTLGEVEETDCKFIPGLGWNYSVAEATSSINVTVNYTKVLDTISSPVALGYIGQIATILDDINGVEL
jgi:hypothetical protein